MTAAFSITDSAAARIAKISEDEPEGTMFRVSVNGGGCSGFQYHFDFDSKPPTSGDIVLTRDQARVVIDEVSLKFLNDSTLDYVETLGSAGFEIKNPNAKMSCGCGNSFSV